MANRYRGEVGFEADGQQYTLRLSFNALCALEGKIGQTFNVVIAAMADPARMSFVNIRALLWAGLLHHHRTMTIDAAGDLIEAVGIAEAVGLIGEAVALAFPQPEGDGRPLAAPGNGMPTITSAAGAH